MTRVYLVKLADWRREAFLVNPPAVRTIVRWCESGQLPARKIGGTWFVEVDGTGALVERAAPPITGNAAADSILSDWIKTAAA